LELATRIVIGSGRIDQVIELARWYADEAAASIARIPGAGALSGFPPRYVDWALEEFVAA
jgi:hypothetical protein